MTYQEPDWNSMSWEDCTFPQLAEKRLRNCAQVCEKNNLVLLGEKIKDKSAKILEFGSGDGTFLNCLLENGFSNIRGIDFNARHFSKHPHLDDYVMDGNILMPRSRLEHIPEYDIVFSHLTFDKSAYRESQGWRGYHTKVIDEIYRLLSDNGLYFASEGHDKEDIESAILGAYPRRNTYLGTHGSNGKFFIKEDGS